VLVIEIKKYSAKIAVFMSDHFNTKPQSTISTLQPVKVELIIILL